MNLIGTLFLATAVALAGNARAHSCSGGPDGGMDATGNQCNQGATDAARPPMSGAPVPAAAVTQRRGGGGATTVAHADSVRARAHRSRNPPRIANAGSAN